MALDDFRDFAAPGALDHVRVNGALRQKFDAFQLARFLGEAVHEQPADDLALGFRLALGAQLVQKRLGRVDGDQIHALAVVEDADDLFRLALAQQAGVDEHADQLVADGAMQQRRRHRRVDTTAQAEQHLLTADLRPNGRDRVVDEGGWRPVGLAAADVEQEVA